MTDASDSDVTRNFYLNYFKIKGNKQFHGTLLSLYNKKAMKIISEQQLSKYVKLLRDFLLIYNFRKIPANRIEKDLYPLAFDVFNADCEREIKAAIFRFLLKDRTYYNLDDIESTISSIRYSNRKTFSTKNRAELIYLFEMLNSSKEQDYEFIQDYSLWSIEHVLNDCEDESAVTELGNLLLLTQKMNHDLDSKPYNEKRYVYLESGKNG